jgi:intein-encoded DNA endonuclease-like protein
MSTWFDNVDSHLKAYWLGFIFADGSISKNKRQMEIDLAIKDVVHLEKFAEIFGIHVNDDSNRCRCRICNVYLCNRLIEIGILPNKCHLDNMSIFNNVPFEFINSFILGFMDGDGSIYRDKRRENYIIVDFAGRKSILKCIKDILITNLAVNDNKIVPHENIFTMDWSGRQAIKVLEWLYKDSPVRLERKFSRYNMVKINKEKLEMAKNISSKIKNL